ncbi:MAG: ATP-binding protein [Spirochaetes bacterium]|nr:ATP-binding protein [Spirochaetota bacterium]
MRVLKQIKEMTRNNLETILKTVNEAYNNWYYNRIHNIQQITEDEKVINLIKKLLLTPLSKNNLVNSHALKELRMYFQKVMDKNNDLDFFIINKDRFNLCSMQDENIGSINFIHYLRPDLLNNVFEGNSRFMTNVNSDVALDKERIQGLSVNPAMFIAAPVFDKKNQTAIAVLILKINPLKKFSRIADLGNFGLSGKSYAFDQNGYLLSNSRFESPIPEKSQYKCPLTSMAKKAMEKNLETNVEGYWDYLGIKVWGSWLWNSDLGIGLATEINEQEALALFKDISLMERIGFTVYSLLVLLLLLCIIINGIKTEKQIRINEERMSMALNASKAVLMDYHISNNTVYVNDLYYRMFGLKRNDLPNSFEEYFINFLYPPDKEKVLHKLDYYAKNGITNFKLSFRIINRRNKILWILGKGRVIRNKSTAVRMVGTMEDITAQKKLENTLIAAKKAAEASNIAKDQFISNISHEIKTPLNTINGNLFSLFKTSLSNEQAALIKNIQKSTQILLKSFNNILDITTSKKTEVKKKFNICNLLGKLFESYRQLANDKKITLSMRKEKDIPAILIGDIRNIKKILNHLIENAFKFTNNGTVDISLTKVDLLKDKVTIKFKVSDSGIGIKKEHLKKIVKNFTQIDGSESRRYGGMGIGLSISNKILNHLNSQLQIKSRYGQGSEFSFKLSFIYPLNNKNEVFLLSNQNEMATLEIKEGIPLKKISIQIKNDLKEFKILCKNNNLRAIALLKQLEKNNLQDYLSEEVFYYIEKAINDYDFEDAFKILDELDM